MTRPLFLLALLGLAVPTALAQDAEADSAAIRATAMDYLMGYYEGDEARMERAIHPDLAKRIMRRAPDGRSRLDVMSSLSLVRLASGGSGRQIPEDERVIEIHILDIEGDNASVKTFATGFFDYMHLTRVGEGWQILNVLWDFTPSPGD